MTEPGVHRVQQSLSGHPRYYDTAFPDAMIKSYSNAAHAYTVRWI